jgi:type II secretion system protein C
VRIRYFTKLAVKLRRYDVQIPDAESVAFYIYGFLALCTAIGVFGTIKTLYSFHTTTEKQSYSPFEQHMTETSSLAIEIILRRNIFNIDGTIPDASSKNDSKMACPAIVPRSALAYTVTGIIFGGTAQSSIVLLEQNSDHKPAVYKFGDTLPSGGKVTNITSDRVFISNNSCPEYLAIEYPSFKNLRSAQTALKANRTSYSEIGFERTGNTTEVTKPWVENILKNKLSSTLQDARAIPNLVNGQIKGFVVTQITPDSVYSKLGLQDEDIVSSINGIELNDAARAIQTLNSLRNETHIEMRVTRNGQPITFNVNIQ